MKIIIIILIVFLSMAAFYGIIPATGLVKTYGIIAVAPLIFVLLRKNLVNTLMIWFFFLLFKEFGKINLPLLPDLSPERIIWLTIIVSLFLDILFKKRKILFGNFKMEIAMIIFIIYLLFSKMFTGTFIREGHGIQLSYLLSGFAIPFSIFFFGKNLIDNEVKARKIFVFFCFVGLYLGMTGIFEHYRLDSLVFPRYIMNPSKGIHFGQSRGPFLQAGVNGHVIGMLLMMLFYLLEREETGWRKKITAVSIMTMMATLLFTYNRTSWAGFVAASLLIPFYFPQKRKLYIICVILMCLAAFSMIAMSQQKEYIDKFAGARDIRRLDSGGKLLHRFMSSASFEARIRIIQVAGKMFLDKPILGFGYLSFKSESVPYFSEMADMYTYWDTSKRGISVHNTLLQLLVELGLVGFGLYLFILLYPCFIALKLFRISPPEKFIGKGLAIIFIGVFIVYVIGMQAREIHYSMFPNALFSLFVGLMSGFYERYRLSNVKAIDKRRR